MEQRLAVGFIAGKGEKRNILLKISLY